MSLLHAIILGIVQGITEFLPISSSGHLLLVEYLFGIEEGNLFFNILLHLASLLAVVIVMRNELGKLLKKPFSKQTLTIVVCCVVTVIMVLFLSFTTDKFTSIGYLGFGFFASAVLILITHFKAKFNDKKVLLKRDIGYADAVIICITQGLATLTGVSMSGTTISTALLLNNSKESSANFSFLISIPIIIGAMIFDIVKEGGESIANVSAANCIVGFVASFVMALLSIKWMYSIIKKRSWIGFSIYLFVLSAVVLLNQYVLMWI